VTKFEADTGCKVNVKTAGTSDEMLSLMNQGGYDLVTALRRRLAALDPRRHGAARRTPRSSLVRQRRSAPERSTVALRRRQALWRAVSVGPERPHVQQQSVQETADFVERGVRAGKLPDGKPNKGRVQAYDGRSTSRTPRCT
jgi:putative spermidine/putrescine transport system substrate-binding protein